MGETSIEWSEFSWNPVRGCSRVSRGCEHCYAESVARRFSGPGQPYEGLVRLDRDGKAKAQWNGTVRLVYEHLGDPIRWTRPRMVFVNSMSDLFHEALPFETIAAIFGVMAASPRHTFQVLTKRPERAREFFAWIDRGDTPYPVQGILARRGAYRAATIATEAAWKLAHPRLPDSILDASNCDEWPLPNVWLGVSVEDQQSADERIPHLLACPAAVRWVSYEPALGPVRFDRLTGADGIWTDAMPERMSERETGLDWIVVGGESGPGARPFDVAWARSTIAQCREADVACFVKQLGPGTRMHTEAHGRGGHVSDTDRDTYVLVSDRKGGAMSEWPEDLRVREMPAGRTT